MTEPTEDIETLAALGANDETDGAGLLAEYDERIVNAMSNGDNAGAERIAAERAQVKAMLATPPTNPVPAAPTAPTAPTAPKLDKPAKVEKPKPQLSAKEQERRLATWKDQNITKGKIEDPGGTVSKACDNSLETWPQEIYSPPGLVGDVVKWILESSGIPQPKFALAVSLTVLGSLVGVRFYDRLTLSS